MMELYTMALGELATNCYILSCGAGKCILIDIGNGAARLQGKLGELGLTPCAILLTHGHYDHVAGVETIRQAYQIPVYIHEKDAVMLRSAQANLAWQLTDAPYIPVQAYETVEEGTVLTLGDRTVEVLHTPGHTPGGVCYRTGKYLFTGDTLFEGSMGRIDLGGNAQEMRQSLARLAAMEGDYEIYPGHFGSSTLAHEKQYNPYLR